MSNFKPLSRSRLIGYVTGVAFGEIIEWYDFTIFGTMIAVISGQFFPSNNPLVTIELYLLALGVGFFARPVGGIVFGWVSDKIGRRVAFNGTVILFGASTCLMGLLPTYATIGAWAGFLLVLLRFGQGLGLGGEFGAGGTFLSEHSSDKNRGLVTSFNSIPSAGGAVLAAAVILSLTAILGVNGFAQWGWRVAFLLSAVLTLVAVYFRYGVSETPIFEELKKKHEISKNPLKEGIQQNWKIMIAFIVAQMGPSSLSTGVAMTGITVFLTAILKPAMSISEASILVLLGYGITLPLYPFAGWVSDRVGSRKKVLLPAVAILAISLYPLMMLISYGRSINSFWIQLLGVATIAGIYSFDNAVHTVFYQECFPHRVRTTAVNFTYAVALAIFGGLTPVVVAATAAWGGSYYYGLIWPIIAGLIGPTVGWIFIPESHNKLRAD